MEKKINTLFYKALNNEFIMYIFFGAITTFISIFVYALFIFLNFNIVISNTFANFIAILFAYISNKIWVFKSSSSDIKFLIKEFITFLSGRIFTYLLETFLLIILISLLLYSPIISKVFTTFLIVFLNYIISKKAVFNKN